jgi:glycosyltransferase involved in cell wall biosynthesis
MRILFVAHQGDLGGATTPILEAIDALAPCGYSFGVLLPEPGSLAASLDARKVEWHVVALPPWCSTKGRRRLRNIFANCRAFSEVRDAIGMFEPELVVSNSIVIGIAARAATSLGLPHMWWLQEFASEDHNLYFDWGDAITKRIAARNCVRAFANSDAVAAKFAGWFGTDRVGRVDYHIADMPAHTVPAPERRVEFRLALVGSLNPQKGQSDAIEALGKVVAAGRDVRLDLYGTGGRGYTARLRARAAALGIADRVEFCGHASDVMARMARADAVLVTSRCEAFGRVTVEAMRAGVPVIGSASGGTIELIEDGRTGLLYPPGDSKVLAAAILRLVDAPDFAQHLAVASREWALARFGAAQFADALQREFEIGKSMRA